jgi:ATP-dependent helicase/nuclease subunit B
MTARLLRAPVSTGKTEAILTRLTQTLQADPFARVWVLLATRRQEDAFRQRLIDWDTGKNVFFNVEFFNFYELYRRLLDMAGNPQRELSDSARFALLRRVIMENLDTLELFRPIATTPGFIRIVADFIYELKQNRVYPETFQQEAEKRGTKDRDLARIYTAYQARLQEHDLVDREGQGWLAVDTEMASVGTLSLLIVDGFDQFTPVQADLLQALAERADETLITLTHVPGREATVGRRFKQALTRLQASFDKTGQMLHVEDLPAVTSKQSDDLGHLSANIFAAAPDLRRSGGALRMVEAPDPATEAAVVLRRVRELLLDGESPDDIMIVLRDWERYRVHFTALRDKYELPLALHYGEPLLENPAVVALMDLLALHENEFQRRDVLDVLRSPYFAFPMFAAADVDLLERISQRENVVRGRSQWLEALQAVSIHRPDDENDERDAATLDRLRQALSAFFALVTPPVAAGIEGYIRWLDALIGEDPQDDPDDDDDDEATVPAEDAATLAMIAGVRASGTPEAVIARDLMAVQALKGALRGLLTAQTLIESLAEPNTGAVSDWTQFALDLQVALKNTVLNPRPNRHGRILVTSATDARGLPHKHLLILGLSEGLFPAQIAEDPLFLDSERGELAAAGVPLATRYERTADDGLFYELICLPRETLLLTRPTLQEGKPWAASPLWRGVAGVFSDASAMIKRERVPIGAVVTLAQAVTVDEVALALTDQLNRQTITSETRGAFGWMQAAHRPYWAHIERGRSVELGRLRETPGDHYSGVLASPDLIAIVGERLSEKRLWSASQLNDYGICPFRFFAKRLLKLEAVEEPESGLDAAQRGSLNHAILEQTYRALYAEGLAIHPENHDRALQLLDREAQDVFADAPQKFGFRADALWAQEKSVILRKLRQLINTDFSDDEKRNPILKHFGTGERQPYLLEGVFGYSDDDERIEAAIDLGEDGRVRVGGYIDRIDRVDDSLIVMDYKSGSTKIPLDEMEIGRNFQMLVYLEGAKAIIERQSPGLDVRGGFFWHLTNQEASGAVDLHDEEHTAMVEQARAHIAAHLAAGRRGDFANRPSKKENGKCVRYCEFHQLCRMHSTTHENNDEEQIE